MKQGLILIDIQNDYFQDGKMELVNTDSALQNTLLLKRSFQDRQLPVFYIQHINEDPNADFFATNSKGANLHESLLPIKKSESLIIKHYPNTFFQTNLKEILDQEQVEQLVICGMMTHICVDSTTRQACELGYQPILIHDACATKNLEVLGDIIQAKDVHRGFIGALSSFSQAIDTQTYLTEIKEKTIPQ